MSHPHEHLSPLLDGELDERVRAEVTAHLAGCAECRAHLEELAAVDALARGTEVAAPPGYFDGFAGRLRPRLRAGRRHVAPAPWLWAAAAGILVAVLAPLTLQSRREASPVPEPARAPLAAPAATVPPTSVAAGADAMAERAPTPAPRAAELRQREGAASSVELPAKRRLQEQERSQGLADRNLGRADGPPPPAAPPPPAPAPEQPKSQAARDAFAQPPATVVAEKMEVQAPREADVEEKADTARSERAAGLAAGSANAGARPPARKATGTLDEQDGAALRKEAAPTTVEEARRARDAWRRVARNRAGTPEGDEARVRAIESSLLAWRLGHDRADLEAARTEARAYLAEEAAPQKDRVRRALAGASPAP
jgi:anti-sigma factor RsiW